MIDRFEIRTVGDREQHEPYFPKRLLPALIQTCAMNGAESSGVRKATIDSEKTKLGEVPVCTVCATQQKNQYVNLARIWAGT